MGPRFDQTRQGQHFFSRQLPDLISGLTRLSSAIETFNARNRPQMDDETKLERYRELYILLLKLPNGKLRCDCQEHLCWLRDRIAELEGRDNQDVQEDYEHRVLTGQV